MKVKTAWNQSCTYGIFTLLPILLFALVSLWQMKMSHDNEMKQIQWELDKAMKELDKSADLHHAAEKELDQERDMMKKVNDERGNLENKQSILKEEIKSVEDKVLNLTSKLLLKEVEAGIEKEENKRLMDTIEGMKKNAMNEHPKNDLLKLNNDNIKPEGASKIDNLENTSGQFIILKQALEISPESESNIEMINSSRENSSKSEQSEKKVNEQKDAIVTKLLEMKKNALNERTKNDMIKLNDGNNILEEHTSNINELGDHSGQIIILKETPKSGLETEKSYDQSEKEADDQNNEIVGKILEIKQKQQELDTAKQELISTINNTETSEVAKEVDKEKISIDVEIRENLSDKKDKDQESIKINIPVNTKDSEHIKTPESVQTNEIKSDNSSHPNSITEFTETTERPRENNSSSEKPLKNTEELVDKLKEIKQKEQELRDAKKELFSNSENVDSNNKKEHQNAERNLELKKNNPSSIEENKSDDTENAKKIHIILDMKDATDNKDADPVTKKE